MEGEVGQWVGESIGVQRDESAADDRASGEAGRGVDGKLAGRVEARYGMPLCRDSERRLMEGSGTGIEVML